MNLPELHTGRTFLDDLKPLVHDLDSMRSRQALSTSIQLYEGLDILNREEFRNWISMPSSGLLWVDGYELPGRPSWLADFALRVVEASLYLVMRHCTVSTLSNPTGLNPARQ